ncbi:hypothetical protein E2320_005640, partial [Naja naja]
MPAQHLALCALQATSQTAGSFLRRREGDQLWRPQGRFPVKHNRRNLCCFLISGFWIPLASTTGEATQRRREREQRGEKEDLGTEPAESVPPSL